MAYHHGDLPRALLAAAVDDIGEVGPAAISLRRIAKAAGVSHTAAAHHFGDKAGLLTALAADGHRLLAAALDAAAPDFLATGLAYARFGVDHPAHFAVMFRPELLHADDPILVEARQSSARPLYGSAGSRDLAIGGWGLVHGLTTLYLAGNLPAANTKEFLALVRRAATKVTGSRSGSRGG